MENGIIVGKIFFIICAFISLICFLKYKCIAKDAWKFMKKYQIKNLNEEPPTAYIKMFRIWSFVIFLIFMIQAMAIGK